MELTCRGDCFLHKVCPHRADADPRRCREYLDKSEVIVLPIKTTPPLHRELTEYCRNRCTGVISLKNRPLITHFAGMPMNDVLELIRAKQEGRLIVLPCKVGDTLFFIADGEIIEDKCTGFWIGDKWLQIQLLAGRTFSCWDGVKAYFGKTVFLTKKEAEAKLKEREG